MWLTFATFVGYAVIYTVILKPLTPQNIVIGGASGAMPPVLGWAAMTGDVGPEALILFLIIFLWTPPHFWALALYRVEDYRKAGLPMLPVTHGNEFTRLQVLLYTFVLFAGLPDALRLRHERLALPGGRGGAEHRLLRLCLRAVAQLLGRAGAQDLPLFPDPPERAVRGAAGRPLPAVLTASMNKRDASQVAGRAARGRAAASRPAAGCTEPKPASMRVDITGADYAKDFSLTDADGKTRTLADFKGKVVVLFFGYAQCPDVCPTTMAEMAAGQAAARHGRRQAAGACSSRSTRSATRREVMKAYMGNFDPSFVALLGTPEQLAALAKDFKVYYKKVDGKTPASYTMDHSAASYVYDPKGRLRLYARYGSGRRRWRRTSSRCSSPEGKGGRRRCSPCRSDCAVRRHLPQAPSRVRVAPPASRCWRGPLGLARAVQLRREIRTATIRPGRAAGVVRRRGRCHGARVTMPFGQQREFAVAHAATHGDVARGRAGGCLRTTQWRSGGLSRPCSSLIPPRCWRGDGADGERASDRR